jgi:DNA polymerase-3 subunit epsilon
MKFKLEKPLVFVKVHTTGMDPKTDRIVSITISKYQPDGRYKSGTRMINPECHIPEEATAINGITNEIVQNEKTFDQVANGLYDFMNDADIAGFNVKFDIEMLMAEFARVGLDYVVHSRDVIDLHDVYMKQNPRNFISAVKRYIDADFPEDQVISTEKNVNLCDGILDAMMAHHHGISLKEATSAIGVNTKILDIRGFFVLNDDKKAVFNVGKYKGKLVADVLTTDTSYYDWMKSEKSGLPQDVILLAEKIIKKARSAKA